MTHLLWHGSPHGLFCIHYLHIRSSGRRKGSRSACGAFSAAILGFDVSLMRGEARRLIWLHSLRLGGGLRGVECQNLVCASAQPLSQKAGVLLRLVHLHHGQWTMSMQNKYIFCMVDPRMSQMSLCTLRGVANLEILVLTGACTCTREAKLYKLHKGRL